MEKLKLTTNGMGYQSTQNVTKYADSEASYCGHCNNKIGLDVYLKYTSTQQGMVVGSKQNLPVVEYVVGQCPICGKPIIHDKKNNLTLPTVKMFDNIKFLPNDVETIYNEMRDAFSMKAYTCCVIAGRTLLAHIGVEQGAKENESFVYYVDYLVENYLSKNQSKPWVDKVRKLGNDAAHKLVIAKKEDAESSLNFISAILKIVYEFPNSI